MPTAPSTVWTRPPTGPPTTGRPSIVVSTVPITPPRPSGASAPVRPNVPTMSPRSTRSRLLMPTASRLACRFVPVARSGMPRRMLSDEERREAAGGRGRGQSVARSGSGVADVQRCSPSRAAMVGRRSFFSRRARSMSSWSFLDVASSQSIAVESDSGAVVGVGAASEDDEANVSAATRSEGASLTIVESDAGCW